LFKISNTEIRSQPTGDDGDEAGGGDANPEEYEPQVDFKPLVKLQEVEVKTGEEDEIAVFKQRCKLYRFDSDTKEWKEKGTGEMKILKHKINEGMYRILMRRDQVLKLCANHRITSDLKFEIYNEKQVRWHAQDYSEGEGKHETLAARFKNEEEAKNFIKEADEAKKVIETMSPTKQKQAPKPVPVAVSTKPNLSDMFKNDNKWKCDACYAPNSNDVVKCACCSTLKPGATEKAPSAGEQAAASGLSKISFGSTGSQSQPSNILFGSQSNTPAKFEFGSKTVFGGLTPSKTTTSTFAPSTITAPAENPNQPDVATIFGNKADMSFGDLAKKSQPSGFGGGFISSGLTQSPGASLFSNFGKAPAPVFGSQSVNKQQDNEDEAGGDDNNNPEEYEPQVDFKPLVKLQEVEVKTGEEDEEVLFKQRCKLYRFNTDTKEWKEKGVGEIKVLKHKIKENCFRVLMRRDQVHKLCANHRIDPSIKLETVNEKQLRWFVNDCSEDEPHPELLLAKFRAEDDVTKFRAEFVKAQQILSANPSTQKQQPQQPKQSIDKPNNLANTLKTAPGTWNCSTCLSQNKAESGKCASCETPKPESPNGDKNNGIF
jgi:E3 SUMO-protein ligase RanBP2